MMKLNSLHILLTYQCNYACDHCFVWGSPEQSGVFSLTQLEDVFQQALAVPTIGEFYFEGGESFLYYPVLAQAVARAHELGFATGIVTNGYWATTEEDALTWLRPLADAGLDYLSISVDTLHGSPEETGKLHPGLAAAQKLDLPSGPIAIDPPAGERDPELSEPGLPLTGGDVMFRGRAAVQLTPGLPQQSWQTFTRCPYENLSDPGRVHLDPFGFLHLCQGLVIGNMFERPLRQILAEIDPQTYPVVGALLAGGPAQLARQYNLKPKAGYVDACHLCYTAREQLRPEFPEILAPDQMYGVV
ncbi:MAG: radical SAM protein [Chloroflexi bacterium]|nr:radical SAM protein [Chloroflexota bacterium]